VAAVAVSLLLSTTWRMRPHTNGKTVNLSLADKEAFLVTAVLAFSLKHKQVSLPLPLPLLKLAMFLKRKPVKNVTPLVQHFRALHPKLRLLVAYFMCSFFF
jgi:hypothetical protein